MAYTTVFRHSTRVYNKFSLVRKWPHKKLWAPEHRGVGKKSEISTAAPSGGQTVGRRAFDPLTFICAKYLGIDWWKPRPSKWSGKKYKKYFPRGGSPQKIETFFTKMAAVEKIMNSGSWNFSMLCGHALPKRQWRRDLPDVGGKNRKMHFKKVVIWKKIHILFHWCSIASKLFVVQRTSNENKCASVYCG